MCSLKKIGPHVYSENDDDVINKIWIGKPYYDYMRILLNNIYRNWWSGLLSLTPVSGGVEPLKLRADIKVNLKTKRWKQNFWKFPYNSFYWPFIYYWINEYLYFMD